MIAAYGRIQREGEVVHLVAHRVVDLSRELASIGDRDARFPMPHGRGDQAKIGGGMDPRETIGRQAREFHLPDPNFDQIKVKTRDFR